MRFQKFDILLVNFPFSNLKIKKIRPAIVINPLEGKNIILCQITTKKRGISKYEVILNKKSCEGNIRFDSNIYLDMIFTLHESLVMNKIGMVKDGSVKKEIQEKIKNILLG
ncbi:MAG TPA: type II toxin-antitoxin system PemK/MazF family toxin [Candidatus Nanoarchaeia archaeon]|nr:type II toxin-antitoxin system PemK/MazF family toxin [Candidatus Nanoarchaeia archaeon]